MLTHLPSSGRERNLSLVAIARSAFIATSVVFFFATATSPIAGRDQYRKRRMNQLFADGIRSPGPQQQPLANPFELSFASATTHGPVTASTAPSSHKSSPQSDDWLTQHSQQRNDSSAHFYTHGERQALPLRRRSNPKLLFMGMRRLSTHTLSHVLCYIDHRYRCGKSSIQKVVFEKLPSPDSLYLEATNQIETASMQYVPQSGSQVHS